MPTSATTAKRDRRLKKLKVALRIALVSFAFVGVVQLILVLAQDGSKMGDIVYLFIYMLVLLSASMLWSTTELCFVAFKKKSLHPGAHVALDLFFWLGLSAAMMMVILPMLMVVPFFVAIIVNLTGLGPGMSMIVVATIEFWLFVGACIDADRLRKSTDTSRTPPSKQRLQNERKIKIGLRSGMILFAFVALVLQASFHYKHPDSIVPQVVAILILACIWSAIDTLLYVKDRRLHPGARIALDLALCLVLFFATMARFTWAHGYKPYITPAIGAFSLIVTVFEFVLLVWACVDNARYRESAGREEFKYEMVDSEEV